MVVLTNETLHEDLRQTAVQVWAWTRLCTCAYLALVRSLYLSWKMCLRVKQLLVVWVHTSVHRCSLSTHVDTHCTFTASKLAPQAQRWAYSRALVLHSMLPVLGFLFLGHKNQAWHQPALFKWQSQPPTFHNKVSWPVSVVRYTQRLSSNRPVC